MTKRFLIACLASMALMAAPAFAVAESEPAETESASSGVARSAFTTAMSEREPTDSLSEMGNDTQRIFYFTEIRDMQGETITHRWEFNGQVMAEVSFEIGGPRWRVNSSKTLQPIWLGQWTVTVVDGQGNELSSESFTYVTADTGSMPAAMQPE